MADHRDPVLPPARVEFRDQQPFAVDYQDIYHSADAEREVARVFLEPCGVAELAERRAGLGAGRDIVRIGELGFGTGLNFVAAAEQCLAAGARLRFVSCEAHPLAPADFAVLARRRGRTRALYRQLAESYPPNLRGWHQRDLAGGRVRLLLWFGEAADALTELEGRQRQPFDAWLLDGFAPDRNPAMWEPGLLTGLGRLSRSGTTVATFTAAGRVRRALETAGFAMRRVDQRPHKRESLAGSFTGSGLPQSSAPAVAVAGGGLAGASVAWQLAQAGCPVTVYQPEAPPDPAILPGSGLPTSVLHGRLLADGSAAGELRCHAYLHAAALLHGALREPGLAGFRPGGALQLAGGTQPADRLRRIATRYAGSGPWLQWLDADAAAQVAGWPCPEGGLYLPDAGTVDLPLLVEDLLARSGAERVAAPLDQLPGDSPVVLACGTATRGFAPAAFLEIAPVHGQIDLVAAERVPRLALVGGAYLVPAGPGLLAAGSTYEYRPWEVEDATRRNLAQLGQVPHHWQARHRGTRCVSSDRLPVAGNLRDSNLPALYVSTGHGSAGNVSAHLAAAVIAAAITGDCPPLTRELEATLAPQRFRERQARRGARHGGAVTASGRSARS